MRKFESDQFLNTTSFMFEIENFYLLATKFNTYKPCNSMKKEKNECLDVIKR